MTAPIFWQYHGKCANIHGHRWVLEIMLESSGLQESEKKRMLMDFGDIKKTLRSLARSYAHALIYEKESLRPATLAALNEEGFRLIEVPFRPTAENLQSISMRYSREEFSEKRDGI